ncbi:carbohydrate kinase family protein [Deinococcus radiophilus]|uniref:Carbohydrate kinase family protein n=1 Tax=Deinococcus radiophilus TaxID=32062 RepID=A0A3S0JX19_9DEIO|nr:carbohydrate kinase family protein [Deinococcus radiophilus]RTR30756.1 carbohydrate kinase family protein [Deinococcus radiophilus]UFA51309.1 carbohydrate kinase family protein [Deinococcus radiophilus]
MKFFVIGDVNVDHIYHLEQLPAPGREVHPLRAVMQPGGSGGTMAVTLARLGHDVTLAASVGDDPFAEYALSEVRSSGVSETAIQTEADESTSTITVMQTADGQRTMISSGGANRCLNPSRLKKKDVETSDALIISAYSLVEGSQREYALKAMEYAKKAKKPVPLFIDLGTGAVNKAGRGLIDDVTQADYLTLNQHEILALTGTSSISAALANLADEGLHQVAVKVGAMGCIVWTPGETELVDAVLPADEEALDSTGAGDTFTAVFAHAVMTGQPLKAAARMANAAGGLAATRVGAQDRHITLEDLAPYTA